jgi:predicted permease
MRGRVFDFGDDREASPVAVVSEEVARRYLGEGDPVGRRIRLGDRGPWWEIVGVVGNVRYQALDIGPQPTIYLTYRQQVGRGMTFVLRTAGSPESVVPRATAALQSVDPDLPVYAVATMDDVIGETLAQRRTLLVLLSLFAAQALFLAAIGVYGVIAYATRQRSREIGIRMALGATRRTVLGLVMGHGVRLGLLGAGVGFAVAAGVTRFLRSFLYEAEPFDPAVFTAMAALAVGIAALAALLPARRATRVDPAEVLRAE